MIWKSFRKTEALNFYAKEEAKFTQVGNVETFLERLFDSSKA
jgi:hypothetical protein